MLAGWEPATIKTRWNQGFRATKSGFPGYLLCDLTREIAMSNQNQNPGQQNQKPGQQQGGGQKPGQQQQDPNHQGQQDPNRQGQQRPDRDR
jgi:hypothetical protein